jgi:hypothetical protein
MGSLAFGENTLVFLEVLNTDLLCQLEDNILGKQAKGRIATQELLYTMYNAVGGLLRHETKEGVLGRVLD